LASRMPIGTPRNELACLSIAHKAGNVTQKPSEGTVKLHSLIIASALAVGFAVPAMAQSMHRYLEFFTHQHREQKALAENPQARSAQAAKLAESFGGKMEAAYWFPAGSEYDGMVINAFPDDVTAEAQGLFARATGNFAKTYTIPLMTADEFKSAMEKA